MHFSGKEHWIKACVLNAFCRIKAWKWVQWACKWSKMIIQLYTVQKSGHSWACWHGNHCHGNWIGSYVHADAVHVLTLWRTEFRKRSVNMKGSVQRLLQNWSSFLSFLFTYTPLIIINMCGSPLERPLVAASFLVFVWLCGHGSLCTGAGLDRKPWRGLPQ